MSDTSEQLGRVELAAKAGSGFVDALVRANASLVASLVPGSLVAISPPQAGGAVVLRDVALPQTWGIGVSGRFMAVATKRDLLVYANTPSLARNHPHDKTLDAFYSPRMTYAVGECFIHDVAISGQGTIVANTRFSALCRVDGLYNFTPIWKPPFISALMPEDRCHLNGFAMVDGGLGYVTAFGQFDAPGEWRRHQPVHGILMDATTNRLLADDLSMPHTPRVFDGRLLVAESGTGRVLEFDRTSGQRRTLCELPGLPRGLCYRNGILFVGLSQPRQSSTAWKLPVYDSGQHLIVGVAAVDIATGAVLGVLEFTSGCREVFDIQLLPDVLNPGFLDINRWDGLSAIETPQVGYWMDATGKH